MLSWVIRCASHLLPSQLPKKLLVDDADAALPFKDVSTKVGTEGGNLFVHVTIEIREGAE